MIKSKKVLLTILCMIFLINISNAALFDIFPEDVCGGGLGAFMSSWAVTCYIAIIVSLGILIIIFLVCRALQIQKGELWAKFEIIQVVATVLILIVIVGFSEFILCTLTPKMLFGDNSYFEDDENMIDHANRYVSDLYSLNVKSFTGLIFLGTLREAMGNAQFGVKLIEIEIKHTPLKGLNSFDKSFELIQMGLITVMITSLTQRMLFVYVMNGMFTIFLPIGILLRCFEPTRKFGGTLIGLTIALGIFWPLMLVLNSVALEGIGIFYMLDNTFLYISEQLAEYEIFGIIFNNPGELINGTSSVRSIAINANLLEPIQTFYSAINMLAWKILSINILGSLFLPLLNFAVIAASMKEFSRFFGEQIDLSNLTRMI